MKLIYQQITTKNLFYPKCIKLRREFLWQPYRIITSSNFDQEEDESSIFIALYNKTVIGCILLTAEPQCNWQRIRQLVVNPSYRHQGIGTQLLLKAEDHAKHTGYTKTALYAFKETLPFFEKRGYKALTGWYTHANNLKTILLLHEY